MISNFSQNLRIILEKFVVIFNILLNFRLIDSLN